MRWIQLITIKLTGLAILLGGAALIAYRFVEQIPLYTNQTLNWLIDNAGPDAGIGGILILILLGIPPVFVGLMLLLPQLGRHSRRGHITFRGAHGDVRLDLDSVQANLNKAIADLPEVKSVDIKVSPSANDSSVVVAAQAVIYQEAGVGALSTANYVREAIKMTAQSMLGVDEIQSVQLQVKGIAQDKRKSKAKPGYALPSKDVSEAQLPGYGVATGQKSLPVHAQRREEQAAFREQQEAAAKEHGAAAQSAPQPAAQPAEDSEPQPQPQPGPASDAGTEESSEERRG